jgi:hypothetical protein
MTDLETWLANRTSELIEALNTEAKDKKLLKQGQRIGCRITVTDQAQKKNELVYLATPTPEEIEEIFAGEWTPMYGEKIDTLVRQNPKPEKDGERWWWSQNYQGPINNIFRSRGLPWRVLSVGAWDKKMVYLGTVKLSDGKPVGKIRYNPERNKFRRSA